MSTKGNIVEFIAWCEAFTVYRDTDGRYVYVSNSTGKVIL